MASSSNFPFSVSRSHVRPARFTASNFHIAVIGFSFHESKTNNHAETSVPYNCGESRASQTVVFVHNTLVLFRKGYSPRYPHVNDFIMIGMLLRPSPHWTNSRRGNHISCRSRK